MTALTLTPTKATVIAARAPFSSSPASGAEVGVAVGESLSKPSAVPVGTAVVNSTPSLSKEDSGEMVGTPVKPSVQL